MKTKKYNILLVLVLLFSGACDQDFVEVNTDPYAVTDVDPALLFAGGQRTQLGTWAAEHTIVQQFVNPYNQGATLGFNFNEDIEGVNNSNWNQLYPGPIRNLTQALILLEQEETPRPNLESMIRIWKAQAFMGLVDTYGNVPYSEAGRVVSDLIYNPEYEDDEVIYNDLYSEITNALATLDPGADFVSEDLFYGSNGSNSTTDAATQVEKWKKLGNSLLLRLGMRYSKIDPSKAESIVAEAVAGGVMTSNADNAYIAYGDGAVNANNSWLRDFSYFYYAAEPFVEQLKSTDDPRGKFILANFNDPAGVTNDEQPDTVLAEQFGAPVGIISTELADANGPYRGGRNGGLNYSQMNIWTIGSPDAPEFWVTYAQTSLLLAEAVVRGWISGDAETYYENAIRADFDVYSLYPNTFPIPEDQTTSYLSDPAVDFSLATNDDDALELINTQYWIVNLRNGTEAYANFRRTGYPNLEPNLYNNNLNGGFPRRFSYPDAEASSNAANYAEAAASMGGDNLLSRVFWDVP